MRTKTYILLFVLLGFSVILAQEIKNKDRKVDERINDGKNTETLRPKIFNATDSTGDSITFRDDSGNTLLKINDEGTTGSITFPSGGEPGTGITTNKLYNKNGLLYFGNTQLGSGGATSLDDLSDAATDATSLFLGSDAGLNNNGTTNRNIGLGRYSLNKNQTGTDNIAGGYEALFWNTGSNNIGIGNSTFFNNTTGNFNVGIGGDVNRYNQQGSYNTMIGYGAGGGILSVHNKFGNVFIGYMAGYNESGDSLLYIENSSSADPLIWGDFSDDSLEVNGDLHVTGNLHVDGTGGSAELNDLSDAISDGKSIFIGPGTGINDDLTNNQNVAIGLDAFNSNQTGAHNVAIGDNALDRNLGGHYNVTVGGKANFYNQNGSYNTMIGYNAGAGVLSSHNKSGNVFIGYGAGYNESGSNLLYIENSTSSTPLIWGNFSTDDVKINGDFQVTGNIITDNSLLIGTNTPATGYILSVDGKAICEELKIQLSTTWPDYVFNPDYDLISIDELEKSILTNKHLPNIPSASDINSENGFEVGEMNIKLLEKVEELTLYIIDLNKQNKQLQERNQQMEKRLSALELKLISKN